MKAFSVFIPRRGGCQKRSLNKAARQTFLVKYQEGRGFISTQEQTGAVVCAAEGKGETDGLTAQTQQPSLAERAGGSAQLRVSQ